MAAHLIGRLHRRYIGRRFVGAALAASGAGFWLTWFGPRWIFPTSTGEAPLGTALGGMILSGLLAAWAALRRSPGELAIAQHLDRSFPMLEESAELLLADIGSLSGLGQRQRQLVEARLQALPERGLLPWRPVWRGTAVGVALWLTGFLGLAWGSFGGHQEVSTPWVATPDRQPESEAVLAEAHYRVELPDYTGLDPIGGSGLGLEVVRGSIVVWEFRVTGPLDRLLVEDPGGEEIAQETAPGIWAWSLTATQDRPLRLLADADGERLPLTDWQLVSVRPDLPPRVTIVSPERIIEIDEVAVAPLDLQVLVTDDFGLDGSTLVATLAQGTGENVEFRERRLPLPRGLGSTTSRTIDTRLDLLALGLAAGSELVFHVETRDGRRPKSQVGRSASRIVRVRGGSDGTVGLGRGLPILTPPEVFRSQRQILLDTEALVADRTKLTPEEFRRRSETIGFDQRALRMRYGTLLGEENVSTVASAAAPGQEAEASEAHDAEEHGDEHAGAEQPTDAAALVTGVPDDLVHSHDSAEMATFFPDPVRSGLRRALAAMWDAERRLRAVEPSGALPFERTALEELQNLKRATRVYVDRVGFDAPALDEGRRLGGELEEIDPRRPRRGQRDSKDPIVRAYQRLEASELEAETLLALMSSVVEGLGSDLIGAERLRWLSLKSDLQRFVEAESPVPEPVLGRLRGALWSWADTPDARPSRRVANGAPVDTAPSQSSPQAGESDSGAARKIGTEIETEVSSGAVR